MNMYAKALLSQQACNLSGLIRALAQDMDEIWAETRREGLGTDDVKEHPVIRLYLEPMVHLNKAGFINDPERTCIHACDECHRKAPAGKQKHENAT